MTGLDYDPNDASTDPTTPQGVGNLAAKLVLDYRATDGSNQTPLPDGTVGYPNNTTYQPTNRWNQVADPTRWQPLCVLTVTGVANNMPPIPTGDSCAAPNYTLQTPATPQWQNVKPFGPLDPVTHYPTLFAASRPPERQRPTSPIEELKDSSNLSETQKARADYWADGPRSEFPPGHWRCSPRRCRGSGRTPSTRTPSCSSRLGNALMDASIASWAAKYQYDSVRPMTAIRHRYKDKSVNSWLGPGKGYGTVLGQNWLPYQELNVVTPPFPEYVSGHSTFSAAARTVLVMFFGNNDASTPRWSSRKAAPRSSRASPRPRTS